jgi:uncharacterized protein (UPF0333 family)
MKNIFLTTALCFCYLQVALCQNINYSQFIGKKVGLTIKTRLNAPYFQDYIQSDGESLIVSIQPDTSKDAGNVETTVLNNEKSKYRNDVSLRHIKFIRKLIFSYQGKETCIVKFEIRKDTILDNTQIKVFQKTAAWQETELKEIENIRLTMQFLKSDSFWAFYKKDESEIPEIDKVKAQFKDSEGILDIDKLGAYLKTKPKELAKYCDFE